MVAAVDEALLGLAAGFVLATLTTPVGVSGAVFLLPVQVRLLGVPSPAVTPTNLLYNVVSGPGSLWRYRIWRPEVRRLTAALLFGTLPGVTIGAAVRVYTVPGESVFRLLAAGLLLPLGGWLCLRTTGRFRPRAARERPPGPAVLTGLGLAIGVAGGVYGIGGGSLIGPILVAWGMSVAVVAPAAIATTFATSAVGLVAYLLLDQQASAAADPVWTVGVCAGLGGLVGGDLGARLQPRFPQRGLTLLLGSLAIAIAVLYVGQAVAARV